MNTNEKNCTVKPALVTTSIEQQLVLRDLNFKIPSQCISFLLNPVSSNHMSYENLFQCSLGRSHKIVYYFLYDTGIPPRFKIKKKANKK